ncbi:unnamed protein product [Mytilus coruscus]|uniref:UBA domain-containing protein n=1 Tax=Mytilus coruscus TaxID=42192 RepID=A0A6J8CHI6_MYTCO|nr:unnamed protein product [Mytilus coruscus]
MVRSSHSMTEVSVMDYQTSNSHLTINGRQNRDRSIDIHAGNASFDRSVHENINQREEHSHLSSFGPIDSNALAPSGMSILKHLTSFDSSEIQEQQSSAEEAKLKHTTTNSQFVCVGNNNTAKHNLQTNKTYHPSDEAQSDVEISQVEINTTMNEQRNNFPAAASELLANGYNRHQINRALDKFYQNRGKF